MLQGKSGRFKEQKYYCTVSYAMVNPKSFKFCMGTKRNSLASCLCLVSKLALESEKYQDINQFDTELKTVAWKTEETPRPSLDWTDIV